MASFAERHRCLKVLGLSSGASEDDIQQAYRRLALTHHPDKNSNDPEATRKFQEISNAYTTLMKAQNGDTSDDDDDGFPFRRRTFYDDDDDDDDEGIFMFSRPSLFEMFAQELMFQHMLRRMFVRRYEERSRFQQSQQTRSRWHDDQSDAPSWARHQQSQEPRAGGSQQRWRDNPRDVPSWARGNSFSEDRNQTRYNTRSSADAHSRSSSHSASAESRDDDRKRYEFRHSYHGDQRGWPYSERKDGNLKEDDSKDHSPNDARRRRRNRRSRKRNQNQTFVQSQPKKPSKKELHAQEKRRQREMEQIGRDLKKVQLQDKGKGVKQMGESSTTGDA